VELVHLVEVVERLQIRALEARLLAQFPQCAIDDPLVGFQAAGDALPQAGQDAAGSAAEEQDLDAPGGVDAEEPDVDQVRPERAQSRSNRSIGTMKTVAPPTSTSSG
jgi:hypothetical protein